MMLHVARMSLYYTTVGLWNKSYLRFFVMSMAVHWLAFFVVYPAPPIRVSEPETIPVSLLDTPEKTPQALMRGHGDEDVRAMMDMPRRQALRVAGLLDGEAPRG